MLLRKVLYTPHFHKNIVSIGQFVKNRGCEAPRMKGSELNLRKEGYNNELSFPCEDQYNNELSFSCEDQGVLYYLKGKHILLIRNGLVYP